MPGYQGQGQAKLLSDNQQKYLWQNEPVTAGALSIAYELTRVSRSFYPWGLSFEVMFSAAPGAFEIDITAANNDIAGDYIQIGTITTANATNVGRCDMPSNVWPKYVAGLSGCREGSF
jgi:hypothetical protein